MSVSDRQTDGWTDGRTHRRYDILMSSEPIPGVPLVALYIDKVSGREAQIQRHLEQLTGSSNLPYLFICGTYIGSEAVRQLVNKRNGKLASLSMSKNSGTEKSGDDHVIEYEAKGQMEQLVEYVCKGGQKKVKAVD